MPRVDAQGVPEARHCAVQLFRQHVLVAQQSVRVRKVFVHLVK